MVIPSKPLRARGSRRIIELVADPAVRLTVGATYRVDGVLHDYLGTANSPNTGATIHVFGRREWRPNIPGQAPFTLVTDTSVRWSVTRLVRRDWLPPHR